MAKEIPYKIYLDESEMPTAWYNLRADMKNKPAPLLNPATRQPCTAADLAPVFCEELVKQYTQEAIASLSVFRDTEYMEALAESLTERRK